MRGCFAALLLALALPPGAGAQVPVGRMELGGEPLADTLLVWVLNSAAEVPIEDADSSAYLAPRLYAIPIQGKCVPDTHIICTHRYFLAIGERGDLAPRQAVFDLGEVGEIVGARVMIDRGAAHPELNLVVQNYASFGMQYNPALVRRTRTWSVELDLETLRIAPEP